MFNKKKVLRSNLLYNNLILHTNKYKEVKKLVKILIILEYFNIIQKYSSSCHFVLFNFILVNFYELFFAIFDN